MTQISHQPVRRITALKTTDLLESFIFYALLVVIALTAIPYGTVQPWWKAVFQSAVFGLGFLAVVQMKLSGRGFRPQHRLLLPLLALVAFMLIQAYLPMRSAVESGATESVASSAGLRPISFAPYDTKLVAFQLLALLVTAGLLLQYTKSRRRLLALICIVVGVGLASTLFGYARLAFQTKTGFLLPHLQPNDGSASRGVGFGQFINYNHFAFLAEMTLGLVLGLTLRRPLKVARLAVGLLVALPLVIAVVYSGSRGGLASMLGEVLFIALMVFVAAPLFAGDDQQLKESDSGRQRAGRIGSLLVTRIILIATFLVAMFVGIIWVGGDPLAARLESVSKEFEAKAPTTYSNTMRAQIWPASWQLAKDHPLVGVGFGAYWIAITNTHRASGEFTPQEAHNDYLELLASGGVVGAALALWFIVLYLKALALRSRDFASGLPAHATGALAGVFAVALHSVTDFGLHVTINSMVFVLLLVIAIVAVPEPGDVGASQPLTQP